MGILEVENLTLTLNGSRILDDLSIDFWEGHVHALVGPNGAGKSTLAFTIMGLDGYRDIEGDILFDGESITQANVTERARRGITLAWQEPARFEGLTVSRFIAAGNDGLSQKQIKAALAEAGLQPEQYMSRAVDESLSGGERKKLELASMLAMRPRFVMLDEPDSGIDVESLDRIFEAIQRLKDYGATVVLVTHSLAVLEQAEHAFLICCGQLIDKGRIDKIANYFEQKCIPCDHQNEPDLGGIQPDGDR